MLQQQRDYIDNHVVEQIPELEKIPPLQANKSATLEDFIEMVNNVSLKALKKYNVEFIPDEGARLQKDFKTNLEKSYILYQVISREPLLELKPRTRQDIIEHNSVESITERHGTVWGQKSLAVVQFNILACDYKTANKVMNVFEELIFKYTAYFKKNGVAEILFKKQLTDQNLDYYRQSLSVRSLQYEVRIEKLYAQFKSDIADIQTI